MGRRRKFEVKTIKHPSGEVSYEAYGRVGSAKEPTRKRFDTWEKANAFKDVLESHHENALSNKKAVYTSLSDDEVTDAEAALNELRSKTKGKSLSWAVHKLFETYTQDLQEKDLSEAIKAFEAEKMKKGCSEKQLKDYRLNLAHLVRVCTANGRKPKVHQVTVKDIQQLLDERNLKENKSVNNVVGNLRAFFRWSAKSGRSYIAENRIPTLEIELEEPRKPRREIITANQAKILLEYAEGFRSGVLVNYIATALFAGIRPDVQGELTKQGLDPKFDELFDLNRGTIEIKAENSKTGDFRDVVIQPALQAFYEAYPFENFPLVPFIPEHSNSRSRTDHLAYLLKKFREKCPFKVPHDGLRHSFCSYHAKLTGSAFETSCQAGDSEATIRKHYLRRVPDDELAPFWNIRPTKSFAA